MIQLRRPFDRTGSEDKMKELCHSENYTGLGCLSGPAAFGSSESVQPPAPIETFTEW